MKNKISFSKIIAGTMTWGSWGKNYSRDEMTELIHSCLKLDITTFDHADIYGDYMVEEAFGNALGTVPSLNKELKIVTKCGIKLLSGNRPDHYIKHYDTSYDHIVWSAENSLKKLKRENIALLLIHRPDPMSDPDEIAHAFAD